MKKLLSKKQGLILNIVWEIILAVGNGYFVFTNQAPIWFLIIPILLMYYAILNILELYE